MKNKFIRSFLVATLNFGSPFSAFADNTCVSSKFFLGGQCEFFLKGSESVLYSQPSRESEKVAHGDWWTHSIRISREAFRKMPLGWIKYAGAYSPPPHLKEVNFAGWVPLDSLVASNALKPIKSCWPIKRVSYSEGDFFVDVLSGTDGRYYDYRDTKMLRPIGHIYFAENIAFFAGPTTPALRAELKLKLTKKELSDFSDQFIAGYDPKTRGLFPDGFKPDDLGVEYHNPEVLKGCGETPNT
jgi:hypothetical protein